jgi:preprotein translocase subunit SecY
MLDAVLNAFKLPDVRRKILFTFGLLVVFRITAQVPVPGVDAAALRELRDLLSRSDQLLGILNIFSGSALQNASVASLGVYPYITATIIMQLMMPLIPRLAELAKEGEAGRLKLAQYTRILTVPLAALQAHGTLVLLSSRQSGGVHLIRGYDLFSQTYWLQSLAMIISMVAGTLFLMWLGELITEFGIGNGISIIIFGGIVAGLPGMVVRGLVAGQNYVALVVFAVAAVLTVAAIVFVQEGQRRIPVFYARRIRGNRVFGGTSTHIPLKVNSAGMIPLIFATSILIFPATIASYLEVSQITWVAAIARGVRTFLDPANPPYWVLYFLLVVLFTYFYTAVVFQQQNLAENLQKAGGFIQGIRPGRPTAEYLAKVLNNITLAGAVFLGVVAVLPYILSLLTRTQALTLSSTAMLIVVGVVVDTMRHLEAQLMMRQYEGFIR